MGGSSLHYFTTMINLGTISIVVMEMFFFCHVTSCEHMFEGLSEFYEWTPVTVIHHLPIFGNHWSSASGDIKHLIYRVTYQNHLIDGPSNFMSASSSWHVITLPSLGD